MEKLKFIKFKRNPDKTVGIMKKGGADSQEWYSKKLLLELRAGKVKELPANAPEYITNILVEGEANKIDLSSVGTQKEKEPETFKEVRTDVKEAVASTPKKESEKSILNKKR